MEKQKYASVTGAYLAASLFCALFGTVYEVFSHGVYSPFMYGSFVFPLLGALPFLLLRRSGKPFPGALPADLIHAGTATLTVGSILQGVLEIYGTTNPLVHAYWLAGGILTAAGWLTAIRQAGKKLSGEPSP